MSVRIGFIGTGANATNHLNRLIKMPRVDIVALSDLALEQIEAAKEKVNAEAKKAGIDRTLDAVAYTDYGEMLRREKLDAVFLSIPPFARGEPEGAVADAGLHLFVEKPVGLDLSGPDRILKKITDADRIVSVGYLARYSETFQHMKRVVAEQTVGMALVMRFGRTPRISWYHRQEKSGGQLIDQVTHQIDMLRYVIGEVDTVYAAAATRINHKNRPDYNIFDVNAMTLLFENGVVANSANNMISGHGVPPSARGLHIFCEGMTVSKAGGSRSPLQIRTEDGVEEIEETRDAMFAQDEAFIQAVADGDPSFVLSDFLSGLRSLATTLAGERSARERRAIKVMDLIRREAPFAYEMIQRQSG